MNIAVGITGVVMNIGGQSIIRNEDTEVKEGKRSVRDGPCESKRRVEIRNKINTFFHIQMRARNTIIDVMEKEIF